MNSIRSIETIPFRLPLARPMSSSVVALDSADAVLVRVVDDDGTVGTAEAIPRPMMYGETIGSILAAYDSVLRPGLIGLAMDRPARFADVLDRLVGNPAAKAAFELAWCDAYCQSLGITESDYLGGYADRVRISAVLSLGPADRVVEEAQAFHDMYGITAFKFKIQRGDDDEVRTAAALRSRFGPGAYLYPDGNRALTTDQALRFARATAELELAWLEEPTRAEDIIDRQRLCHRTPIPILGDDSVWSPAGVVAETGSGRCHGVSLKIARSGISASTLIAGYCETAGVQLLIGSQGESSTGTRHALAYALSRESTSRHPAELGYYLRLGDDLATEPLEVSGGELCADRATGAGITIDEDKLRHYAERARD